MSYSDEPNVISSRRKSRGIWVGTGVVVLLVLGLASIAFYPQYQEFRRKNTPVGPNMGPVYFISFEGERYSMELARSPDQDYHLVVFLRPTRDRVPWDPEEHRVRFRIEEHEQEFHTLDWNAEEGGFGPSEDQFHPAADYPLDIEIWRGEELVWEGNRWGYRLDTGHDH